jgi:cytochrome c biogenesis protein CcmG, thiol:disulfide interchange protein DsbE
MRRRQRAGSLRFVRRAAIGGLLVAVACSHGPSAGVVEITGRMPALEGSLLGGGRFPAAEYRGKVVVVNFWNPFCGPCIEEAPNLVRAWRDLRGEGVLVVGVHYVGGSWPSSVAAAKRFLRRHGVTYPILEDPSSELAREFGIQGIPSTIIADATGELRFRILGGVKPGQVQDLVAEVRS